MTYTPLPGDQPLQTCSVCGTVVADSAQHDANHKYLSTRWSDTEVLQAQLQETIRQREDERGRAKRAAAQVQARSVRSKAATNLAEAYMRHRFGGEDDTAEAFFELSRRTTEWELIRHQSDAGITKDYEDALDQLTHYKAQLGSLHA